MLIKVTIMESQKFKINHDNNGENLHSQELDLRKIPVSFDEILKLEGYINNISDEEYIFILDLPKNNVELNGETIIFRSLNINYIKLLRIVNVYIILSIYDIFRNYPFEEYRKRATERILSYLSPIMYSNYNIFPDDIKLYIIHSNISMVEYLFVKDILNKYLKEVYYPEEYTGELYFDQEYISDSMLNLKSKQENKYRQKLLDLLDLCSDEYEIRSHHVIVSLFSERLLRDSFHKISYSSDKIVNKEEFHDYIHNSLFELIDMIRYMIFPDEYSIENKKYSPGGLVDYEILASEQSSSYILSYFYTFIFSEEESVKTNLSNLHNYVSDIIKFILED